MFRPRPVLLIFQDLIENPKFTLMIEKGRTIEKYLSSSDPVTSPETSKLWTRIKGETKSIESDMNLIERELVENPKSVFFGPTLGTRLRFKSIPCYIESASESLYKESWFCWFCFRGSEAFYQLIGFYEITDMRQDMFTIIYLLFLFRFRHLLTILNQSKLYLV